jgi:hypothetical protein
MPGICDSPGKTSTSTDVLDRLIDGFLNRFAREPRQDGSFHRMEVHQPEPLSANDIRYIIQRITARSDGTLVYRPADNTGRAGVTVLQWEYCWGLGPGRPPLLDPTATPRFDAIHEEVTRCVREVCRRCEFIMRDEHRQALEARLVDEIVEASLPEQAPALYDPKNDRWDGIVNFLRRVWYDPWIKAGLFNRPYFRARDPRGEQALQNWLRRPEHFLPFEVPTKSQTWDRKLNDPEQSRAAWRTARAIGRRREKEGRRAMEETATEGKESTMEDPR